MSTPDNDTEPLDEADAATEQADDQAHALPGRRVIVRGRGGRMPSAERLYIVAYDIADQKRWRRVFRTMKGYGRWLQLSVFQCRLSGRRRADLGAVLDRLIHHKEDHVVILDLGLADEVDPRVESIGKSFTPIAREAIIV
ncbi:MAG: CRISPR-associated endonuclease Cas2 [Terricaulis sp.]